MRRHAHHIYSDIHHGAALRKANALTRPYRRCISYRLRYSVPVPHSHSSNPSLHMLWRRAGNCTVSGAFCYTLFCPPGGWFGRLTKLVMDRNGPTQGGRKPRNILRKPLILCVRWEQGAEMRRLLSALVGCLDGCLGPGSAGEPLRHWTRRGLTPTVSLVCCLVPVVLCPRVHSLSWMVGAGGQVSSTISRPFVALAGIASVFRLSAAS